MNKYEVKFAWSLDGGVAAKYLRVEAESLADAFAVAYVRFRRGRPDVFILSADIEELDEEGHRMGIPHA